MPRYCAVKLCKNRGGIPSKDNKKISFYPFPLRDEARLQKWVDNMKREEWTPSRHQYLCSDHFTEDSFDVRWGIRYLKHTAVPTIFPFLYDESDTPSTQDDVNKHHSKKNAKPEARTSDVSVKPIRPSSPPKKRALILKKHHSETYRQNGDNSSEKTTKAMPKVSESEFPTVLLIRDLDPDSPSSCEALHAAASLPGGQTAVESTSLQPVEERILVTSCVSVLSEAQHSPDAGSTMTVLCTEAPAPFSSSEAALDGVPITVSQTVSAPLEQDSKHSRDCVEDCNAQVPDSEHILQYEHSYSRQDTDKGQLWNKIASLHMKIMELEKREEGTVAKINSLETLIAHLKKENIVCEEKQKALEDYFTSVFL
ncbi:THAP domain-containing protein 5-like [Megalops cyprinoides]|uniref:THAP domain-containing protein 5-like n=1 Tax=Megalops cyprinoides TaxID=118141 RepID=UPI001863C535|nr:THAP domain-containing protein 5-like [Megalops cyprinoides]